MKRVIARTRRGVILLTCLIVITLGALVGTTILYFSGAEQQAAEVGFRSVQSRAMAWSGVQAVMAELDSQREEILQGAAPELTQSWLARSEEAGTQGAGLRWGYRLLLLGEVSAEPQAARLDVNTATPEMLARLSGVSKELAAAIVTARKTRRFTSVSDLLSVPGMTSELLFEVAPGAPAAGAEEGPEAGAPVKAPERGSPESDEPAEEAATTGAEDAETAPPPRTRPLAEFLTAFSFDPEVQLGYGAKASEVRGNQRINLNVEWTDALGEAIERRFDKGVADGVRGLLAQGRTFEKPSDIVKTIKDVLCRTLLPPTMLNLEITEAAVKTDPNTMQAVLEEIASLGVRFSVNDFGASYSSLNYLSQFPINCLKLNSSFVDGIGNDQTSEDIIQTLLHLAQKMNIQVSAVGVESAAQQAFLSKVGCRIMQGRKFIPPIPNDELSQWFTSSGFALTPMSDHRAVAS